MQSGLMEFWLIANNVNINDSSKSNIFNDVCMTAENDYICDSLKNVTNNNENNN